MANVFSLFFLFLPPTRRSLYERSEKRKLIDLGVSEANLLLIEGEADSVASGFSFQLLKEDFEAAASSADALHRGIDVSTTAC